MAFIYPVDIGNRALQYCGASLISTFTDNSKNAVHVGFAYDKARRAELRRAVWRFASRRTVLRPIVQGVAQLFSPPAYNAGTTYALGQCVTYLGVIYQSTITSNLANTPGSGNSNAWQVYVGSAVVTPWSAATTYYNGELVSSGGTVYLSIAGGANLNDPPPSGNWVSQGAAVATLLLPGPLGFDNSSSTQQNVYRLPFGYLRVAPQDRKAADTPTLVVTAGMKFNDWQFEGKYLVTSDSGPIFFRFAGDISDVTQMEDLFCEGLAARLALQVVEPLTQSAQKMQAISGQYDRFMREARAVNAIELGSSDDEPDDDRLAPRPAPAGVAANG